MFKHAALNRRCLVLASGWYEWQKQAQGKQPFAFHLQDDALFALAGIWTRGPEESGAAEDTDANPVAAPVHARMPAILNENACKIWLDAEYKDAAPLEKLLAP